MRLYSPAAIVLVTSLALAVSPAVFGQEAPAHGRVSFADASALVKGDSEAEWSFATQNSLVLPGDTIWAVDSGVVELEFSGGAIVRMADGSKLDVTSAPPAAAFRGWNGSFYIQRMIRGAGTVQFESPVASISVDIDSQVRVDVLSEGSTTVTVRWGRAVIDAGGAKTVVVTQGKRSYIDPGFAPSTPLPFDRNIEDDFDTWNRERARLLALGTERNPIVSTSSQTAPIGAADLNAYGEWVYVDNDYYWRPTYVDDYVPYRNGCWNYVPSYGHVWVGNYPFSYTTSHYGYWDYHSTYGYIWSYDGYWSPAHVAALRYGDHFVWSPINRYGNTLHHGSDYWSVGGLNFSTHGTSYAYAHDVLGGPHQVYGYDHGSIGNVYADDIYVWNIDIGTGHGGNRPNPYRDTNLRVRDYEPRRVMRGPSSAGQRGISARAQIASLQSTQSRDRFHARGSSASSNRSSARTPNAALDRTARVRSTRVNPSAISTSRNTAQRAARSSHETSRLVMRRSGVSAGTATASTNDGVWSNPTIRAARARGQISSASRTITIANVAGVSLNRTRRSRAPETPSCSTAATQSRSRIAPTTRTQAPRSSVGSSRVSLRSSGLSNRSTPASSSSRSSNISRSSSSSRSISTPLRTPSRSSASSSRSSAPRATPRASSPRGGASWSGGASSSRGSSLPRGVSRSSRTR